MIFYFILSYFNIIVLTVWGLFLIIVAIHYFKPRWNNSRCSFLSKVIMRIKKIPFSRFILVAILLRILHGVFLTWGQYHVWATGNDISRVFVTSPLDKIVPFSSYLEWLRPLFENPWGSFMHYAWVNFWLDIFLLFLVSGGLYLIFRVWKNYRGSFDNNGPELLLVLMLISGWPGIFVSVFLGFIFAILLFVFSYIKGKKVLLIEPVFILSTLVALFLTQTILNFIL